MRRIVFLLAALGGCASLENRMVYHPRRYDEFADLQPAKVQDVTLTTASGQAVHAQWYAAANASGAVLYCPGNAGNLQSRVKQAEALQSALSASVLIFDYPGYGKSEGTPSEKGCYEAAAAAYQWLLRDQKMPGERIILYGESLGGAVAIDLATKAPHAALVLERTFTSIPDIADYQMPLLPAHWLMSNRFDSLAKVASCPRPIFMIAADKDAIIPLRQTEQLQRAATVPTQLFLLKNLGHNDPLPADAYSAMRTFLANNAGK